MNIINPTYKAKIFTIQELKNKYDFYRFGENIVHRFPVYKYNGKPLITGEFIYDEEEYVIHINEIDINTNISVSYNKSEYGKSKVTEIVNSNMQKEINKYKREGLIIWKLLE